jgi:hypothetical protein
MAEGEGMSVRFHKKGDAEDLAEQLITILQSPELQRQMAEHNFTAGVEMTMTSVVKNYLRWFELHKCKRAIRNAGTLPGPRRAWLRALRASEMAPNWDLHAMFLAQRKDGMEDRHGLSPAGNYTHLEDVADPIELSWSKAKKDHGMPEEEPRNSAPKAKS